ncbi:hypothetical protein GOP47_0012063 [Adiantum capillus-veneris]|uniref:Copper transport protein n=1 Tax=Adiantum capillus-veneris TaxID=13818 RepID=A0A9D4ZIA3_ADICA|nr:hypothetical protein GOP47_0012063 [Adiantum capillus-veneris]
MMHMTFYWGKQATILFDGWKTSTWGTYSLSLAALFLASIVLQYIANLRITGSSLSGKSFSSSSSSTEAKIPLLGKAELSLSSSKKLLGSALFGVRVGLGYLLMLAVMSFNAGVFLAVVLGFAAGHFLFASESSSTTATVEDDANACGC